MEKLKTDVCIIGAGPGGMLLSLLLLRAGNRVVLVDRAKDFEREFRGEFLQPGALQLMDKLGLLPKLYERGEEVNSYRILDHNKVVLSFSFDELPGKYRTGLNVSQAFVLPMMLKECETYEGFVFKKGYAPAKLIEEGASVRGVQLESQSGEKLQVTSKLLVGSDGRSSQIRKMANMPVYKHPFQMDVLWTKLPKPKNWGTFIEVRIHETGYLVTMPTHPDQLQLGIDMPKGGLLKLREQGLDTLVDRLVKAMPEAEKELREALVSWNVFQQLPVTGALATKWYKDGLVLIGDAAHTIGPIAGQGVTQALKDAAILAHMIRNQLGGETVGEAVLRDFQSTRYSEVKQLYTLQSSQEKLLMSTTKGGALLRRMVYWAMMHTPLKKKLAVRMSMNDIDAILS